MLYLIQHAEAMDVVADPNRDLTPVGEAHALAAGRFLAGLGVEIGRIWQSGKLRAAHTAEIIATELGALDVLEERTGLQPGDDPEQRIAEIEALCSSGLVIVSHLPFLSRLVNQLLGGGSIRFRNAGVVALSHGEGLWMVEWAVPPDLFPHKESPKSVT